MDAITRLREGAVDEDWFEALNDQIAALPLDDAGVAKAIRLVHGLDAFASAAVDPLLIEAALNTLADLLIRLSRPVRLDHLSAALGSLPTPLIEQAIDCLGNSLIEEYIPIIQPWTASRNRGIASSARVALEELEAHR